MSAASFWLPFAVAAAVATATAVAGSLFTDIGPWYESLRKPSWQPPNWAFGPAWTAIFALTALSGALAWRAADDPSSRQWIIAAFALNCVLNVAWSALFFRLRRPDWALAEVVLLWLSIALLIVVCGRSSTASALLLVPYLAWVTFAGILNLAIVRLNAPF